MERPFPTGPKKAGNARRKTTILVIMEISDGRKIN
jgi:hypothetical protein